MTIATIAPGVLTVGSAIPDPPFELIQDGAPAGLDIALTRALAAELGLGWASRRYEGADFNGIFDALAVGAYDCIASGTTVTAVRRAKADFLKPYLISGQSLVCNAETTPELRSIDDLRGRLVAVQRGNTSEPVVEQLKAEGKVGDVKLYPYDGIGTMLDDLEAGRIAAVMKLAPVMHWLVRGRPSLRVVQERITHEEIALSVVRGNGQLRDAVDAAQGRLAADGTLARLTAQWTGP